MAALTQKMKFKVYQTVFAQGIVYQHIDGPFGVIFSSTNFY